MSRGTPNRPVSCAGRPYSGPWHATNHDRTRHSNQDQGVPWRDAAIGERRIGSGVIDCERGREQATRDLDGGPVCRRISDDEQRPVEAAVGDLAMEPPQLVLGVEDARFQLDAALPTDRFGHREIPCSKIPRIPDRHLGANDETRVEQRAERISQAQMRDVTQRFTTRVCLGPDIESDRCREPVEARDRDPWRLPTLDPTQFGRRDPGGPRNMRQRKAGNEPGGSKVVTHPNQFCLGTPLRSAHPRITHG